MAPGWTAKPAGVDAGVAGRLGDLGRGPLAARLVELVGELSLRSDRFRALWARQDVRLKTSGVTRLLHPQVGPLDLRYEKLALPAAPGQMLVTYHAEPGSPSQKRLELLAHLTTRPATARPPDHARPDRASTVPEARAAERPTRAPRP